MGTVGRYRRGVNEKQSVFVLYYGANPLDHQTGYQNPTRCPYLHHY